MYCEVLYTLYRATLPTSIARLRDLPRSRLFKARSFCLDLAYIIERERISVLRAQSAACPSSRASHAGLARGYAALLDAEPYPFRNMTGIAGD